MYSRSPLSQATVGFGAVVLFKMCTYILLSPTKKYCFDASHYRM